MNNGCTLEIVANGRPLDADMLSIVLKAARDVVRKRHRGVRFVVEGVCSAVVEVVDTPNGQLDYIPSSDDEFHLSAELRYSNGDKTSVGIVLPWQIREFYPDVQSLDLVHEFTLN